MKKIPLYDICTIKEDAFASDELLVSRFAPYLKTHSALCKVHRHNFFHLIYFTAGSGSHYIDFINFKVIPGQIYFMTPGQVHSWNFKTQPDGYVINFSENFFRSFLASPAYLEQFSFFLGVASKCVVNLPDKAQKKVQLLMEQILNESGKERSSHPDIIKLWMLEVFMITAEHTQAPDGKPEQPTGHPVWTSFKKLVDEKYMVLNLPRDYASLLYVSPNYLNNLCNRVTGKSAGAVIRDRVLLEAKRMLVNMDLQISEIANQLNFTDPSHFSKFFKKETHDSPENFRKKILNNSINQ